MSVDRQTKTTTEEARVAITHSCARDMGIVAKEASHLADRGVLSASHEKTLEVVSRMLTRELTAQSTVGIFAVRESDDDVATLEFEDATLRAYLKTLDAIATMCTHPHRENVCQRVFSHLTERVDVGELGLTGGEFETLQVKDDVVFG